MGELLKTRKEAVMSIMSQMATHERKMLELQLMTARSEIDEIVLNEKKLNWNL